MLCFDQTTSLIRLLILLAMLPEFSGAQHWKCWDSTSKRAQYQWEISSTSKKNHTDTTVLEVKAWLLSRYIQVRWNMVLTLLLPVCSRCDGWSLPAQLFLHIEQGKYCPWDEKKKKKRQWDWMEITYILTPVGTSVQHRNSQNRQWRSLSQPMLAPAFLAIVFLWCPKFSPWAYPGNAGQIRTCLSHRILSGYTNHSSHPAAVPEPLERTTDHTG